MILHLLRMRRNVNQNVFNDRKNVSATTYNGTREKALGQCKLSVVRKGVKHRLVFKVLQGKYTPILSLDASEGM